MTPILRFESISQGLQKVFFADNDVYLGDLVVGDDGFWVYFPELKGGCWSSHIMRAIADKIDELDKPWQEEIEKHFSSN